MIPATLLKRSKERWNSEIMNKNNVVSEIDGVINCKIYGN